MSWNATGVQRVKSVCSCNCGVCVARAVCGCAVAPLLSAAGRVDVPVDTAIVRPSSALVVCSAAPFIACLLSSPLLAVVVSSPRHIRSERSQAAVIC